VKTENIITIVASVIGSILVLLTLKYVLGFLSNHWVIGLTLVLALIGTGYYVLTHID
jgi:hypothetical protein